MITNGRHLETCQLVLGVTETCQNVSFFVIILEYIHPISGGSKQPFWLNSGLVPLGVTIMSPEEARRIRNDKSTTVPTQAGIDFEQKRKKQWRYMRRTSGRKLKLWKLSRPVREV